MRKRRNSSEGAEKRGSQPRSSLHGHENKCSQCAARSWAKIAPACGAGRQARTRTSAASYRARAQNNETGGGGSGAR